MDSNIISHNSLKLKYVSDNFYLRSIFPEGSLDDDSPRSAAPNFHITVAGDDFGIHSNLISGGSHIPFTSRCVKNEITDSGAEFVYYNDRLSLEVKVKLFFIPGANVIRQINTVKNAGDKSVTLTHFSSMNVMGIAGGGLLPWFDKSKIMVHYCRTTWEGEAQWRTSSLEELGLYPNSVHQTNCSVGMSSVGSWSTYKLIPTAMIENTETGQIWYFQIETSSAWHYEIGHRKAYGGAEGELYMEADAADEINCGWHRTLAPGESFESAPTAFGCANGGFDEAVAELTKYRRSVLKPKPAWDGECPLIFNDYMDCLWGSPTEEKLLPLIDKASEAGAEAFCIDAGWFAPLASTWASGIGDWEPSSDRFGGLGLEGVLSYIKSKGLIPGVWFEMESCMKNSKLYERPDEWFLCCHGKRLGGSRCFLDYRNPDVRAYMHERIDRLASIGAGYIKNDYNQSTGSGDDKGGRAPADGNLEAARAFYSFIDEVRARHPRLIIENCGSGGLRQDYGILSRFHLQSVSDQEIYHHYPSIIIGSLANLLPEQTGIWALPYPVLFLKMNDPSDKIFVERHMSDGEETIFNMVNSLCGNMYMSGRIDCADEYNFDLIKQAVNLYKSIRVYTHHSMPVFPLETINLNDKAFACVGLQNKEAKKLYLAVWRINTADDTVCIPLAKYCGEDAQIKMAYPSGDSAVKYVYNRSSKKLSVKFTKLLQARFLEVNY